MKKITKIFLTIIIITLTGCNIQTSQGIILFVGDGCPHCVKVEEFITANKIAEKIKFSTKEVYHNQSNARLLAKKAKICGLPSDSIGLPFLWTGEKCLVGDEEIIKYFQMFLID